MATRALTTLEKTRDPMPSAIGGAAKEAQGLAANALGVDAGLAGDALGLGALGGLPRSLASAKVGFLREVASAQALGEHGARARASRRDGEPGEEKGEPLHS